MLNDTTCGLCGASSVPVFRAGCTMFNRCSNCKILSRSPMLTPKQLDRIYCDAYDHGAIASGRTNQETPASAIESYARYICATVPEANGILDFGCGTGHLTLALRREGRAAVGLEFSRNARDFALREHGLQLAGELSDLRGRLFDLVIMIEVIEHLINPLDALVAVRTCIKPGGHILLSTPNLQGARARISGDKWAEAQKDFHLHLFEPSSLAGLLSKAGFRAPRQLLDYPLINTSKLGAVAHRLLGRAGFASRLFMIADVTGVD